MSNKIYFKNASQETINVINYGLELIFVKAVMAEKFRKEREEIKTKQSKLDSESEEYKSLEKSLTVISDKSKNLNAYVKLQLFGNKETIGTVDKIGFSGDFVTAYQNMSVDGNVELFRKYIREHILRDIFCMDVADKPVRKLAERLSVAIGIKNSTSIDVRKGILTSRQKDNIAKETAFRAFAEYVSETNEGINILKESVWSVQVDYDQNLKVSGYKLVNNLTKSEIEEGEE